MHFVVPGILLNKMMLISYLSKLFLSEPIFLPVSTGLMACFQAGPRSEMGLPLVRCSAAVRVCLSASKNMTATENESTSINHF